MTIIKEPQYCPQTDRKIRGATIRCFCGAPVELALHGADTDCDRCHEIFNFAGQHITHPQGRGFDYCGEYDGPDDY